MTFRRSTLVAGYLLALSGGWAFSARAQFGEVHQDLGIISVSDLALINPSLYFRPIDGVAVRPGAAAWGVGGAYIARASGPVAIGWCPAGLAEVDDGELFVDGALQSGGGSVTGYPAQLVIPGAGPIFTTGYRVDPKGGARPTMAAGAMPIWRAGEMRLVGGLSWRRYYDVSYPEETVNDFVFSGVGNFPVVLTLDRAERGGIEAVGPSIGLRLNGRISVGANLNVLTGRWRSNTDQDIAVGAPVPSGGERLTYRYDGFSTDLGARVSLGDRISIAGRFTPGHTVEVSGGEYHSRSVSAPGQPTIIVDAKVAGYEMELPSSMAVGAHFEPFDRLAVSADLTSQNLSETSFQYTGARPGSEFSLPLGLPLRDVSTFHVGAEYLLFRPRWGDLRLRGGFRTAPLSFSDMDSTDVSLTDGDPLFTGGEIEANAISVGLGLESGNVSFDLGADRTSYDLQKVYFDSPSGLLTSEGAAFMRVSRSLTTIRFSATYRLGGTGRQRS